MPEDQITDNILFDGNFNRFVRSFHRLKGVVISLSVMPTTAHKRFIIEIDAVINSFSFLLQSSILRETFPLPSRVVLKIGNLHCGHYECEIRVLANYASLLL